MENCSVEICELLEVGPPTLGGMCVPSRTRMHLKPRLALYLGPSWELWKGAAGHLAAKPQGTGKEQGRQ